MIRSFIERMIFTLGLFLGFQSMAHAETRIFESLGERTETLVIYSSTDVDRIQTLIQGFQKQAPGLAVEYHDLDTVEIFDRVTHEMDSGALTADLTLSSAMDLQIKLVNDGYSRAHYSEQTDALPNWANWRNEAFGFTYEPAVMLYNRKLAPELGKVTTRFELANLLSQKPFRMRGRVVTYDPVQSGLGYLFGTQDAIQSQDFWYLARSLGDVQAQRVSSSSAMIDKVARGDALIAYNVLGSYALARARKNPDLKITIPQDYALVMSRIAVITKTARNPVIAGQFIDFLLSRPGQEIIAGPASLYALRTDIEGEATAKTLQDTANGPLLPIRLGPGLLVYLDRLKRDDFLDRWQRTMDGK